MRKRLIVGNWKMHKTAAEADALVRRLADLATLTDRVEVVLAPPFTAIHAAANARGSRPFLLAAQNLFWADQGAFTGEISAPMLTDLGCRYVILGHSERRRLFNEQDDAINKKVRAALRHGLQPILCVGESIEEREGDRTVEVVSSQLAKGLTGLLPKETGLVTVAYEPVWAIGTGRAASPAQAVEVHAILRRLIADLWGRESGALLRILYGGSVTPDNAAALFNEPEIDGALVGGACLDPQSFAKIIAFAQDAAGQS